MSDHGVTASLPVHLAHFVGRERELAELARLLAERRLLTLTGAGGSGKTRLAAEVAARCADDFARVGWVDLAPLADPTLVAQQIAAALRVPEVAGVPALGAITADVADATSLLVLDNCEHLTEACAALAQALLAACPGLRILATSREALGVAGETAWLVPPLARSEAVTLFEERARASLPTFRVSGANQAAVEEICRRLDGMPLAIELAAARVRVLSPAQIAERLDDAFRLLGAASRTALPRQKTLRGMMDWSHQLLTRPEQVLFRRLSVFAGGFSLEAAESVCADDVVAAEDILDGVAALVDKSLVVMEAEERTVRYRLLETVRQYGAEKLEEAGERERLREAHAMYVLSLTEGLAPRLISGERTPGLIATLRRDGDNIRAACAWSLGAPGRHEIAMRFAHALFWYWYGTGQFREAREFIDAVLAAAPADADERLVGRLLLSSGLTALANADVAVSRDHLARSAELLAKHDPTHDDVLVARVKHAATFVVGGEPAVALQLLAELEAAACRNRTPGVTSFWYFWAGWAALVLGDLERARPWLEANLAVGRENDHPTTIAHSAVLLGRLALLESRFSDAAAFFREGLLHHGTMTEGWGLSLSLGSIASIAAALGRYERAVLLQGGLDAMRLRFGFDTPETERAERERVLALGRRELGDAFSAVYARGLEMSGDALLELAMTEVGGAEAAPPVARETTSHPTSPSSQAVRSQTARAAGTRARAPRTAGPLRVHALGALQVAMGDVTIDPGAWGSARPRELLVYLLLHPEGATKEQVGLAFWPEASALQLRNNFHVTLHRVRKALGDQGIVVLSQERYRVAPEAVAEFDVTAFERDVEVARRLRQSGSADALTALEAALSHYRGDLLAGEPAGEWHRPFRDALRRLYIDAATELAGAQMREERFERAAETWRRILLRNELQEGAVRALMTCQLSLGERAQALRTFERFSERLREELGAEPEAATLELAARIGAHAIG